MSRCKIYLDSLHSIVYPIPEVVTPHISICFREVWSSLCTIITTPIIHLQEVKYVDGITICIGINSLLYTILHYIDWTSPTCQESSVKTCMILVSNLSCYTIVLSNNTNPSTHLLIHVYTILHVTHSIEDKLGFILALIQCDDTSCCIQSCDLDIACTRLYIQLIIIEGTCIIIDCTSVKCCIQLRLTFCIIEIMLICSIVQAN